MTFRVVNWTEADEGRPAREPSHGYLDDAGFDLFVSESVEVPPQTFRDVHSNVALEMPSDLWAFLTARSSTLRKRGLMVTPGIIDPGYRGELFAGVWNLTNEPVQVDEGDRLAQVIFVPNLATQITLSHVNWLEYHARGTNGFGSTGGHNGR